jgi:dihydroorotate dehydrogenase (NAD+) catalytic subunit
MDLKVPIGKSFLPNPVGAASGTFGYGSEYKELVDIHRLGALYTKAVTLEAKAGNDIPRIVETPAGLLNSIGLANVGVTAFIREKMPYLSSLQCPVVANIAGSTEEEYLKVLERLERDGRLWGYEINLSCPNVKEGCLAFGTDPGIVEKLTARLRDLTEKPLIVKLTPNVTDIAPLALAAESGGADGISCINTLKTGGLSGPAIRPVGVAMTYRVSQAVRIPVIGIGGIMNTGDALQYLLAGASAVQIGTANFVDPDTMVKVIDGIAEFCRKEGLGNISEIHRWKLDWDR